MKSRDIFRGGASCLLLLALLLCAACGAEGQNGPQASASPSGSAPTLDISFTGPGAPGMAADAAGFENSLWGDSMETVLGKEGLNSWLLVNEQADFSGIPCKAYYAFAGDRLAGGYYSLTVGVEHGGELLRAVIAYLTELYGEPESLYDGNNQPVADPALAFDDGLGTANWSAAPGDPIAGTIGPIVYGLGGGVVNVSFTRSGG